ncbi:MAG: flagellar hook-associated protein FlgK [Halobacteriovoraceae bacterium]|nr:flagellar hook-associated protein FlgK [Halobacteriovoraceae bacterium]
MGADLFSIGRSSLRTSKKSLATTSHNIANANTEGFSRQKVTAENNTPIQSGKNVFGTGVNIKTIKRVHDKLVEKKLNHSLSDYNFNKERTSQLSNIEELFNEINSDGMNKILNRFFNSFRELSNQPENNVVRTLVRDNASIVISDFKRIGNEITRVKDGIDKKIESVAFDANQQGKVIASLNKEITRLENMGGETGDLRDQRDNAVRVLSDLFEIKTYEDENSQYVVNIVGAGSLVAGGSVNTLRVGKVGGDEVGSYKDESRTEIFFEAGGSKTSISENIESGMVAALVKTRNVEIVNLRKQLDEMAHGLIGITNAIHKKGYVNKPLPTDQNGNVINDPSLGKVTDINFFKESKGLSQASLNIDLSDEIQADVKNITTGLSPNSPGDNRIAIAISKVQHEKLLGGGSKTFEESYLESIGSIGLATNKSKLNTEQSKGILAQAKNIKERLSGVSIDEEATNMVKYQHAYEASAKMIKTADEMFDSVIGMMR